MGTITSSEPSLIPGHAVVANLIHSLAHPLFQTAMTAAAVNDPLDKNYSAWWNLRQTADKLSADRHAQIAPVDREEFDRSLFQAHRNAHPSCLADPPDLHHCACETAKQIRALVEMLPGLPSRPMQAALRKLAPGAK